MKTMTRHLPLRHAILAGCVMLLALAGCGKAEREVDARTAFDQINRGEMTLIDVRMPVEWKETGVAQGAHLLNMAGFSGRQRFAEAILETVDGRHDAPIALICKTGSRTSRLVPILEEMGFTNIRHIPEGMVGNRRGPGWIDQNLPVLECTHPQCV